MFEELEVTQKKPDDCDGCQKREIYVNGEFLMFVNKELTDEELESLKDQLKASTNNRL